MSDNALTPLPIASWPLANLWETKHKATAYGFPPPSRGALYQLCKDLHGEAYAHFDALWG